MKKCNLNLNRKGGQNQIWAAEKRFFKIRDRSIAIPLPIWVTKKKKREHKEVNGATEIGGPPQRVKTHV